MKLPITIILDLDDYASNYEFNKDLFLEDIRKGLSKEISKSVKSYLDEELKQIILQKIDTLDFFVILNEFIKENKDEVVEAIAKIVEHNEKIYNQIDFFRNKYKENNNYANRK